jgi:putative transposase
MKFHRLLVNGGTYFFTLVTYKRIPLFSSQETINLLSDALQHTATRMPFESIAYVILPDHMHFIWSLPETSNDYSTWWRLIKSFFTHHYDNKGIAVVSSSRKKKKEQAIWQRRFWEHWIRDEVDLLHHIEYIHFNPIKHGYVNSLMDWNNSSFLKYVSDSLYPSNWGKTEPLWEGESYME